MDVRLWVTRKVYKHVGRARIRELQEWFCNLVPSVLIVNQLVEMPRHRYVLSMPQMLQLCTVYATDAAALYCLCAVHHRYCSSVLLQLSTVYVQPNTDTAALSMCSPSQLLQLCTFYVTDTAALYCLCTGHRYCSSVLSMPQILQLCTVYVQPTTYTATLYCLYHRYCSSVLSMPQTLQLCTVADLYYVQPTTETAALYCLCADSPSGQCLPGGRVGRKSCAVCDRTTNQQSTQSRTYKHTSVCVYLIVLSMNE